MTIVNINLEGGHSYPIYIGVDLANLGKIAKSFPLGKQVLVVSDDCVYHLYGDKVKSSLKENGFKVNTACVPEGESMVIR